MCGRSGNFTSGNFTTTPTHLPRADKANKADTASNQSIDTAFPKTCPTAQAYTKQPQTAQAYTKPPQTAQTYTKPPQTCL